MSSFTIKTNPSVKEFEIWLLKISFGVVFVVFGIFGVFSDVLAEIPFTENFDSYELDSTLQGQGGWATYNRDIYIKGDYYTSSPHSALWSSQAIARRPVDDLAEGFLSGNIYFSSTGGYNEMNLNVRKNNNTAYACSVSLNESTGKAYKDIEAWRVEILTDLDLTDKWSSFKLDFRASDNSFKFCVNTTCTEYMTCYHIGSPVAFSVIDGINFKGSDTESDVIYIDDISYGEPTCSLENCSLCEEWFECQVVGCCWYYQPWYPPPFDNYCDICEGECSYPYNCGLCATETTCEAAGCFWTGDYCTQFEWECGGELACQFCATQETCEAEGCNWNALSETCWYVAPTLPSSWSTYYNTHGGYETPAEFVNELAQTTGETLAVVSGLFEGFLTSFNTADALAKGSALGNVIPKGRGYLKIFDGLFGHYPIGETFVFILIFMLAIGLFRIARQLISLVKP